MTSPILEVRDLWVEIDSPRGTVRAVNGVSFSVAPSEFFGIVGESGCGKTTLLRAMLGLLPRRARMTGGEVILEGRQLGPMSAAELQEVRGRSAGIVFQEPMTALNPVMKIGEQISEAPRLRLGLTRRQAHRRTLDLMREVGIPDPVRRYQAYPHELSGGMRQRVLIAIALSVEPKLLLCDEPTTALDVTIQDQILKLLLRIGEQKGLAVVYVTHDLAVVAQTCQRLAVMYAGQFLETGSVEVLFREPRHPYTAGLLASVPDFNRMQKRLDPIPGSPPDLVSPLVGCPFRPRCPYARDDCATGAFPLLEIQPGRATACIHHQSLATHRVGAATGDSK